MSFKIKFTVSFHKHVSISFHSAELRGNIMSSKKYETAYYFINNFDLEEIIK